MGPLTGMVMWLVNYFDEVKVLLYELVPFLWERRGGVGVVGSAFASKVRECEAGVVSKLEDIYQNMSDTVLQGLRRRLPVTRTKFDWDKLAVAKLAADLQSAAGLK